MIIKTTTTQTAEIVIPVPYFCKYDNYLIKVMNEEKALTVTTGGFLSVSMCDLWIKESDIAKSEPITEEEFNDTFLSVLNNITDSQLQAA